MVSIGLKIGQFILTSLGVSEVLDRVLYDEPETKQKVKNVLGLNTLLVIGLGAAAGWFYYKSKKRR